jgi:hypothetical protein
MNFGKAVQEEFGEGTGKFSLLISVNRSGET